MYKLNSYSFSGRAPFYKNINGVEIREVFETISGKIYIPRPGTLSANRTGAYQEFDEVREVRLIKVLDNELYLINLKDILGSAMYPNDIIEEILKANMPCDDANGVKIGDLTELFGENNNFAQCNLGNDSKLELLKPKGIEIVHYELA